jgi:hypothetical protein
VFEVANDDVKWASFNETMAWLALDTAVGNAVTHGSSGQTIRLAVEFDEKRNRICFTLTNDNRAKSSCEEASGNKAVAVSTHVGLNHIKMACQGAGGDFNLNLGDDGVAVFTLWVPATVIAASIPAATSVPPPTPKTNLPRMLRVHAIDDSKMICKGYERLLLPQLKVTPMHCFRSFNCSFLLLTCNCARSPQADTPCSSVCCPQSPEDVAAFLDAVLAPPVADIVLLDQNIELQHGAETAFGTDLAKELRQRNFAGLVAIRSANAEVSDITAYMQSGHVDVCIGKEVATAAVVAILSRALEEKTYGA